MIRRRLLNWIIVLLFLSVIGVIAYWFYLGKSQLQVLETASNFSLVNTSGNTVKLNDSDGKVRLLTFIYTNCPTSCPLITYNMSRMQNDLKQKAQFGTDVEFVSVTLDPQHDTGPVLKQYAQKYGADFNGWQFLTGDPQAVTPVLKNYGILTDLSDPQAIIHTQTELLIDKNGNVRKRYGADMDIKEVEKDIRSLL